MRSDFCLKSSRIMWMLRKEGLVDVFFYVYIFMYIYSYIIV